MGRDLRIIICSNSSWDWRRLAGLESKAVRCLKSLFLMGGQAFVPYGLQPIGRDAPKSWRAICFSQSLLVST